MKAVILAGGAGTALLPLTLDRPAALLPVANRPVVEHLLEHLVRHGVQEATVALHHCPYPLEAYLGEGTRWGVRLRYALERCPLGTAGAARRIAARWTETFVLAFGTTVSSVDLAKALAFHRQRAAALTLIVAPADGPSPLGVDDGGGIQLNGARGPARFVFTGLALAEPGVLTLLQAGEPADLLETLVPRLLAADGAVHGYVTPEPALVVRTLADLATANRRALAGNFAGLVLPGFEVRPGIWLSRGARVHRDARLVPPVLLGCDAFVGRGATLEGIVAGADVIIGPRASLRHAVVLARTHVGPAIRLDGAVVHRDRLGRPETGTWTRVADPRILGDTRAPLRPQPGSLGGRLAAAGLLLAGAPLWGPLLLWLAVETRGRPLRARRVVGARGRTAHLPRLAVGGPLGRLLRRAGLLRAPQLWSVARGDLHWVGTSPRSLAETRAGGSVGGVPGASPGLVTLAALAPAPLGRQDRQALDRLYAATRTRWGDVRLLAAATRRRLAARAPAAPATEPRLRRLA